MGNSNNKPLFSFGKPKPEPNSNSKPKPKPKPKKRKKGKCKTYLEQKIALNLAEFKKGNYNSRQQAIAVAYSQVKKEHPRCKRFLEKKV